jgi:hypothetical protein
MNSDWCVGMTGKTVIKGTERLTVDVALKQIGEDCKEIRKNLDLQLGIASPDKISRIEKEGLRIMEAKKRKYSYYEIGFRFFVDHAIVSLEDKIDLKGREETLLREAVGRLYHNAPLSEFRRREKAADGLNAIGERGKLIFDAWIQEQRDFRSMRNLTKLNSDMFDNPVYALTAGSLNAKNFGEIAKGMKEIIEYLQENGYSSFYE